MRLFKLLFVFGMLIMSTEAATAQHYSGEHTFDGENKNEVSATLATGRNIYGIKARGEYHFQVKAFHMFASAEALYNRYNRYNTNEFDSNVSLRVERGYWDITLGESIINYSIHESGYTEPHAVTT